MNGVHADKKALRLKVPSLLREVFERLKKENSSMRGRFAAFVLLQLCGIIAFALLLLSLFGILSPASSKIDQAFEYQLNSSGASIQGKAETLAAYGMVFSDQMSTLIRGNLTDNGFTMDDLENNLDALTKLESDAYLTVYNNMRIADCSGAFYFLNTTVNSTTAQRHYSGLYLKAANLSSEKTIQNRACLFLGASSVARENDINLHSSWQNEMLAGVFTEIDDMMNGTMDGLGWLLTIPYQLPDTWERARFVCVPIRDEDNAVIGVCGYEISDLLFKLSNETVDAKYDHMVCALLDKAEGGYIGQISGSRSGYTPPMEKVFLLDTDHELTTVRCGKQLFCAMAQEMSIGNTSHTLVVMLPMAQYEQIITAEKITSILILLIISVAAILSSVLLSKRYVSPILKGLEQIKSDKRAEAQSSVPEINDLFVFLAEQDRLHEDSLVSLEQERQTVQTEKERLEQQYQDARLAFEKAQTEYDRAQGDLSDARQKLDRLAYSRKSEIDPDDYQFFLEGLQALTRRERDIFEWYLEGKSAAEILELTGIKEGTLKSHNHSILNKLGVSSRRQMLRYAELMKQQGVAGK